MTEETPRVDREGIHIERELAERVAIEEDLDANVTSEYRFPSPTRRRIAAWVYLVAGVIAAFVIQDGWVVTIALGLIAAWHFLSSWPLQVDEHEALATAAGAVEFPIGHSSAAVRFTGWRSRPRWSVVLYSAAEPPDQRALVVVDAINGEIAETPYVEPISPI